MPHNSDILLRNHPPQQGIFSPDLTATNNPRSHMIVSYRGIFSPDLTVNNNKTKYLKHSLDLDNSLILR